MLSLSHLINDSVVPGFLGRHPVFPVNRTQDIAFWAGSDFREDLDGAITSKFDAPFHSADFFGVTACLDRWLAKTDTRATAGGPLSLRAGGQEDGTHSDRFPNAMGSDIARQ
jgi:hypothetical protein